MQIQDAHAMGHWGTCPPVDLQQFHLGGIAMRSIRCDLLLPMKRGLSLTTVKMMRAIVIIFVAIQFLYILLGRIETLF